MNILECTANGAGACRNESMILDLTAERDAARAEADALRETIDRLLAELSDSELQRLQAAAERDAMREKLATMRCACQNVFSNLEMPIMWADRDSIVAAAVLRGALDATA